MSTTDARPSPATAAEVKAAVARTFDAAAGTYETVGPAYFDRFGRRLVELAEVGPGMRVLDVGCGAGAALVPAAEAAGPDGHVLGIDLAAAMVERSRAAIKAHRLTNAEARSGDAAIPGVGPGDRDRVLAAQVLFFLPDLPQALRAYRHILRPGGVLAASSWGPDDKQWQAVQRALFSSIPGEDVPRITPAGAVFRSDETIAESFEEAGFADVRSTVERYDVVFDSAEQWLGWHRSTGARALWDAVPADRRAEARRDGLAALHALASPDGRVTMGTTVRYTVATRP